MGKKTISQQLAEKTFRELGADRSGKPKPGSSRKSPVDSHNLPFRIPVIEKTTRQALSSQGYKASAAWQTTSLLRDLILLWTTDALPEVSRRLGKNFRTISRSRAQVEDAARSMVSTLEEGWARPSTKEYLDFIGFSQGSLAEIRGDMERFLTDGLLQAERGGRGRDGKQYGRSTGDYANNPMARQRIPTPSKDHPYPPLTSRKEPARYGSVRERLREFTGREVKAQDLSYELFIELINKADYLFQRTVAGLRGKIVSDEKRKLGSQLNAIWKKHW